MDDDQYSEPVSPPSLKQKLKQSLCFSCCFPHRRRRGNNHLRYYGSPPPLSSDEKPTLIWVQAEEPPDLKDKCRTVFSFIANGANVKHKRPSSAEFRYDPLSYSLNFEDGYDDDGDDAAPLRNFSARLPPSPPQPPVKAALAAT